MKNINYKNYYFKIYKIYKKFIEIYKISINFLN